MIEVKIEQIYPETKDQRIAWENNPMYFWRMEYDGPELSVSGNCQQATSKLFASTQAAIADFIAFCEKIKDQDVTFIGPDGEEVKEERR